MGDTRKEAVFGIPQFAGSGYENWKFRVEKYMKSVGLLEVMNKEVPTVEAEIAKFNEQDGKAANIIISFIHDDMLDLIREKNTAKEIWTTLENVYAKKSVSSQTLVRKQLAKLKMAEGTSVREHLKIFDELIRQLKSAGAKLEESDLVSQLFVTLPEMYDPLVTALENFGEGKLTLDVVRERLLAEELKKSDRMTDTCREKPAAFAGNKQKYRKFNGKCNRCHQKGHMAKNCRVKIQAEANVASGDKAVAFMAGGRETSGGAHRKLTFKLDSGASDHLVNEKGCFKSLVKLNHPVIINVAKENESLYAWYKGIITGVNNIGVLVTINDVLYVPDLRANLISVKKLARADIEITFGKTVAKMNLNGTEIGICPLRGDFYELDVYYAYGTANICRAVDVNLWHRRLGHLGSASLKTLAKIVTGMPTQPAQLLFCEPCIFAKQCREPFNGTRVRATRLLELIHSDVCGPITPIAWDGSRYFVSFIDDYSHFAVVYMLKKKSQVFEKFQIYESMATAATGLRISKMTVDQGREYCSRVQEDFYKSKGIQVESTVAYTPQQNGVSERFNRTVIEKVRAMLTESRVPKYLWSEAVLASVYLLNRSPTSAIERAVTPVELWTKVKPDLSKLRVFGSKAYAWIPPQLRKKLDMKSQSTVMVGYAPKGYRLWNTGERKLLVARDVKFNEDIFPYINEQDVQSTVPLVVIPFDPEVSLEPVETPIIQGFEQEGENQDTGVEPTEESDVIVSTNDEDMNSIHYSALPSQQEHDGTSVRHSERERKAPGKWKDYIVGRIFTAVQNSIDHDEVPSSGLIRCSDPPQAFKDVYGRPDEKRWLEAIADELMSLNKNKVWRFTECPRGVTALKAKWIFNIKEDANGKPIRYKARLVAKGFLQKPGLDYGETYAPVAKLVTIRTVLAVAVHRKLYIHQLDVKTAFLYGDLKEDIYMAVPDGVSSKPNQVCKLEKSLYGLKQSPKCWNEKLNDLLIKSGFTRSSHDYCLYVRNTGNGNVYITIYVDDLLLVGDNMLQIEEIKKILSSKFEMTDCGQVKYFLGIKINYNQSDGVMELSQEAAIERVLVKFGLENCNPVKTPIEKLPVIPQDLKECIDRPYRELLGSLMYAMLCARPDICYAVGYMGRFQQKPHEVYWQMLKRIVRYLKGTTSMKLKYECRMNEPPLVGFADADWASDMIDRKSVSGYVFKVYGSSVSWASKKQQTVATSSSEAEYIALSAATSEGLWLKGILEDLKEMKVEDSFVIFEDNRGCIAMSKNTECKRVKHIDIKHHFIRDHINNGTLEVEAIGTNDQLADIFTKGLDIGRLKILRSGLGLVD